MLLLSVAAIAQTTIFDFEGAEPTFNDFNTSVTTVIDNPDAVEPNTSAKVVQNVVPAGAAFAGVNIPQVVDFSDGKIFTMQVWSPAADVPVLLKLERTADDAEEVVATFTGAPNSWQELTFDFSSEPDQAFSSVTVFMNFNVIGGEEMTFFWDNLVQDGDGGGGTNSVPQTAAFTPQDPASGVVSIFSDAYDDVIVDTYRADFSVGDLVETMIDGNATLRYDNIDFVGIEMTSNPVDLEAAGVNAMHIDYWSANGTFFGIKLVDFGADGAFGGGDDVEHQIDFDNVLFPGEWEGIDLALSDFTGLTTRSNIAQIILVGQPAGVNDVFIDNIYFYSGVASVFQMDLPVTFDDADVDYGLFDFEGAESTIVADPEDATNLVAQTTKMAGAATFAGTILTSDGDSPEGFASPIPFAEGSSTMSVRVWSPTAGTTVRLKVENVNDPTTSVETETLTTVAGAWDTLVFDFSAEAAGTAAIDYNAVYNKAIIFFDFGTVPAADATYLWDNMEFGGIVPEVGPMTAAPTPTVDAADVISIFSDAYTNVDVDAFLASFSMGTLTDTLLEGNATLLYRDLSFAGIEMLGTNAIDLVAAGMTHLHIDFWSINSETFRTKLVDFGGDGFGGENDTEFEIARDLANGEWVGVEYPLTAFAGMNQTDISQLIISSAPAGSSDVWIDNIYFYAGTPLGAQMDLPLTFDDEGVDYGFEDFGGAASMIVADPEDAMNMVGQTIKTAGAATFAGTVMTSTEGGPEGFASRIPLAEGASMMSVRVWSPTAGTPVRLKIENKNDPTVSVETEVNTTVAGAWDTLIFDFTMEATGTAAVNFAAVYDKAVIFFDFGSEPAADATYYWDDVMLAGPVEMEEEPMTAAPTPVRDPNRVISLYSNAFDDVTVDTWLAGFSVANLEDILIEGNDTKKYTALNFAGIETIGDNAINLTDAGMTMMHVDYWTPNMTTFRIKLVDFGGDGFGGGNDTEHEITFETAQEEWVGLDIPLEDFMGMNQTDINQIIISGIPVGDGTVYLDNIYFYNLPPDGTNTPLTGVLEAFPNPVGEVVDIIAPERMKKLTLYNFSGQVVGNWSPNTEQFAVEMGHLPAGNYVALVSTDQGLMTIKLVKQ